MKRSRSAPKSHITPTLVSTVVSLCGCAHSEGPAREDLDISGPGKVKDGLRLVAKVGKQTVNEGEAIDLQVSLQNVSTGTLYVNQKRDIQHDFFVVVRDEHGDLRPFNRSSVGLGTLAPLHSEAESDSGPVPIAATGAITYRVRVSQIYDMTTPGTYSITVKRIVARIEEPYIYRSYIVSNAVRVQVRDAPAIVVLKTKPVSISAHQRRDNHHQ